MDVMGRLFVVVANDLLSHLLCGVFHWNVKNYLSTKWIVRLYGMRFCIVNFTSMKFILNLKRQ